MRVRRVVIGLIAGLILGSALSSSGSAAALRVVDFIAPVGRMIVTGSEPSAEKEVDRTEIRNTPIYALVLARRDGKLGPNLHPASADCATLRAAAEPSQRGTTIPCGFLSQPGRTAMRGAPLDQIAVV